MSEKAEYFNLPESMLNRISVEFGRDLGRDQNVKNWHNIPVIPDLLNSVGIFQDEQGYEIEITTDKMIKGDYKTFEAFDTLRIFEKGADDNIPKINSYSAIQTLVELMTDGSKKLKVVNSETTKKRNEWSFEYHPHKNVKASKKIMIPEDMFDKMPEVIFRELAWNLGIDDAFEMQINDLITEMKFETTEEGEELEINTKYVLVGTKDVFFSAFDINDDDFERLLDLKGGSDGDIYDGIIEDMALVAVKTKSDLAFPRYYKYIFNEDFETIGNILYFMKKSDYVQVDDSIAIPINSKILDKAYASQKVKGHPRGIKNKEVRTTRTPEVGIAVSENLSRFSGDEDEEKVYVKPQKDTSKRKPKAKPKKERHKADNGLNEQELKGRFKEGLVQIAKGIRNKKCDKFKKLHKLKKEELIELIINS